MKKVLKLSIIALVVCCGVTSCSKDFDDNPQSASVNDFIWKGLNQYYYWLTDSPDLADSRFGSTDDYFNFIDSFTPENLFDHLLVDNSIDRFSVMYSDY